MQQITIAKEQANQRLDKFLRRHLPEAGTSFLYKMLRKKNITLNGKKAEGKEMLAVGDVVCFFFSDETYEKFTSTANGAFLEVAEEGRRAFQLLKGIQVIYENAHMVILNKPAGILSQKAQPGDLSLNEWLLGYLLENHQITPGELSSFRPSVCNRLDRNTSGLVLCGRSLQGSRQLSAMILEREIGKFYQTICMGRLSEDASLDGYLWKDEKTNRVQLLTETEAGTREMDAQPIRTNYHVMKANEQYTQLEVELITGKTHQIRAHLSGIGHPLIGDYKYGNRGNNDRLKKAYGLEHQLLHAARVVFPADTEVLDSSEPHTFEAPLPALFVTLQRELIGNYHRI